MYYRQENAPAKQAVPEGVFWLGTRFKKDVMIPYLRTFTVVYDDTFWREGVEWAAAQTAYREEGELPSAAPEHG